MIAQKTESVHSTFYLPSTPKIGCSLYAVPGLISKENKSIIILQKCLKHFSMTEEILFGKKRQANIVIARHVTMWFLLNKCKMNLSDVGRMFGKDHTTVINARRSIEDQLSVRYDNDVKMHIRQLNVIL